MGSSAISDPSCRCWFSGLCCVCLLDSKVICFDNSTYAPGFSIGVIVKYGDDGKYGGEGGWGCWRRLNINGWGFARGEDNRSFIHWSSKKPYSAECARSAV